MSRRVCDSCGSDRIRNFGNAWDCRTCGAVGGSTPVDVAEPTPDASDAGITDDYRRGALAVTEEWLTVLAVLASTTLESMETVTELTLKHSGHPYFQGKLALILHLREMAEGDRERFGGAR